MFDVQLIGGPLHGQTIRVRAQTEKIEIRTQSGSVVRYLRGRDAQWYYDETGQRERSPMDRRD